MMPRTRPKSHPNGPSGAGEAVARPKRVGAAERCLRAAVLALLAGLLAVGCGITEAPKAVYLRSRALAGGRVDVRVLVAPNANENSPVAVDLIYVYDESLLERLTALSAAEWFAQREQVRRDFLPGEGADVWSWEWVPGQKIPVQQLPLKPAAMAGLVFADYHTPGNHRFRVDPFDDLVIRLGPQDLTVETEEALEERLSRVKENLPVTSETQ